jgi:hypothetical protein
MKFLQIPLVIILSFVVAFVTGRYVAPHRGESAIQFQESAYDRIIKSGNIRCGYIVYPPNTIRDPKTGAFSGISYDIMSRIA